MVSIPVNNFILFRFYYFRVIHYLIKHKRNTFVKYIDNIKMLNTCENKGKDKRLNVKRMLFLEKYTKLMYLCANYSIVIRLPEKCNTE